MSKMSDLDIQIHEILNEECYNRDLYGFDADNYINKNYDIISKVLMKRCSDAARED